MREGDPKSHIRDLKVILSFVTRKLGELELGDLGPASKTSVSDVAHSCMAPTHKFPQVKVETSEVEQLDLTIVTPEPLAHPFAAGSNGNWVREVRSSKSRLASESVDAAIKHKMASVGVAEWVPFTTDRIPAWTFCGMCRFYWIGITNNSKLKQIYIVLKEKVRIHANRSAAMTNMASEKMKEDMTAAEQMNVSDIAEIADSHDDEFDIALAQSYLFHLESVLMMQWPELGITTAGLFQMASSPVDIFVDEYTKVRDGALSHSDLTARRMELVKTVASGVAGLETLCEDLNYCIAMNDQLLFKALLLILNFSTCLGQYIYATYIHPERIYKCKMP